MALAVCSSWSWSTVGSVRMSISIPIGGDHIGHNAAMELVTAMVVRLSEIRISSSTHTLCPESPFKFHQFFHCIDADLRPGAMGQRASP